MAEGKRLERLSPKAPVFKTGGLPIILTLRRGDCQTEIVSLPYFTAAGPVFSSKRARE